LASCGFACSQVDLHPVDLVAEACNPDDDNDEDGSSAAVAATPSGGQQPKRASLEGPRVAKLKSAGTVKLGSFTKRSSGKNSVDNPKLISALLGMPLKPLGVSSPAGKPCTDLTHQDEVLSLAFSPNGARLYSAGEDASLRAWDPSSCRPVAHCPLGSAAQALAVSPSGRYVAVGLANGLVTLFDAGSHKEVGSVEVEGEVLSVAVTLQRATGLELLAVGTTGKQVVLASVPGCETLAELKHGGDVRSVSFSPWGSLLAAGGGTDEMHGLMTRKGTDREMKTVVWEVSHHLEKGVVSRQLSSIPSDDVVHATAFAPSGKVMAIAGEACTISVLLVDKRFEQIASLPSTAGVRCLSWSPDSRCLASAGEGMQVYVWDIVSERVVLQLPKATDWITSVAFCPSGTSLAFCGYGSPAAHLHAVEVLDGAAGEEEPDKATRGAPSSHDDVGPLLTATLSVSLPKEA